MKKIRTWFQAFFGTLGERLLEIEKNEGFIKLIGLCFAWSLMIGQFLLLAIIIIFTLNTRDWALFMKEKFITSWFNTGWIIITPFILDAMYQGSAIKSILRITPESTEYDKRTAMYFLLGIMAIVAYGIKTVG